MRMRSTLVFLHGGLETAKREEEETEEKPWLEIAVALGCPRGSGREEEDDDGIAVGPTAAAHVSRPGISAIFSVFLALA
jgi:hypothetical protein